jgi:hypothetical protein
MSLTGGHLDSFLEAGLTAEQIVALVKADIAVRERAVAERRAKDADRQRRHRKSRPVTVTNGKSADPPKEDIKPPSSEANASGYADPIKEMFDVGVALLVSTGSTDKQARSLIGKWRKAKGDGEVLTALLDCRARAIAQPVEWLERRLKVSKWVSASGHEYRGSDEDALREAERRNDMDTYWRIKGAMSRERKAA